MGDELNPAEVRAEARDAVSRFVRTALSATFHPRRFLVDWRLRPERYLSPLRLVAINGFLMAFVLWAAALRDPTFMSPGDAMTQGLSTVIRPGAADAIADTLSALFVLTVVWSYVLAIYLAAWIVGLSRSLKRSVEAGAAVSAVGLITTLPGTLLVALYPQIETAQTAFFAVVGLVYLGIALRALFAASTTRIVCALPLAMIIWMAITFAAMVGSTMATFYLVRALA